MGAYAKTIRRLFGRHIIRFISIVFIVTVSVGLISGIGSSAEKIEASLADFYRARHVSDFILKSTADGGFSDGDIEALRELYGEENVNAGASVDVMLELSGNERRTRLYFLDFSAWTVNLPQVVSGKGIAELSENEILCLTKTDSLVELPLGEAVTLDFADILKQLAEQGGKALDAGTQTVLTMLPPVEVTVGGTMHSALAFAKIGEPAYAQENAQEVKTLNDIEKLNKLDCILYLPKGVIPVLPFVGTPAIRTLDLYIALPDRGVFDGYTKRYNRLIAEQSAFIQEKVGECAIITLRDNFSFSSFFGSADTIYSINAVFLVAIVLVAGLVVSSTMTRLLEEERAQIACMRTLGYSGPAIVFKYMLFAVLAAGIAGVAAYLLGFGLAAFIYYACGYSYFLPTMSKSIAMGYFLLTFFAVVLATLIATAIVGARMTRQKPVALLRPKPPRAGKSVFLQKIPFIWNHLSFKHKSTLRNVLRYKTRFFMTVVAVAFSMALVVAGLALLDLCLFHDMASTMLTWLAVIIVVFAGLLTMGVIYTLTNINVSERMREIATLMVLGYGDGEVTGYIYREVYVNTFIGILFGFPLGALLLFAVFTLMNFGSLGGVSWFMWLIAPVVVLLFTLLVTLILRRRILKIDMNESLKAIE